MAGSDEPWYAAKTVYYWRKEDVYEERIVLHKATSFDDAWIKNEAEITKYMKDQASIGAPIDLVKTIEIFHLFDETVVSGSEIFSTLRRVPGDRRKYIASAYEDGMDFNEQETDQP